MPKTRSSTCKKSASCTKRSGHPARCNSKGARVVSVKGKPAKLVTGLEAVLAGDLPSVVEYFQTHEVDEEELLEKFNTSKVRFSKLGIDQSEKVNDACMEKITRELSSPPENCNLHPVLDSIKQALDSSLISLSGYPALLREDFRELIDAFATHFENIFVLRKVERIKKVYIQKLQADLDNTNKNLNQFQSIVDPAAQIVDMIDNLKKEKETLEAKLSKLSGKPSAPKTSKFRLKSQVSSYLDEDIL